MMDNRELIDKLGDLVKLDVDAVRAYDSAISAIDLPDVKDQLTLFREDHERHIREVSDCIRRLGAEPPRPTPDFKGYFIKGMTAIQSALGTHGALTAMKTNEKLTNRNYSDAINWDCPLDVRDVLQRNFDDERRHLAYIEKCIDDRVWEMPRRKTA